MLGKTVLDNLLQQQCRGFWTLVCMNGKCFCGFLPVVSVWFRITEPCNHFWGSLCGIIFLKKVVLLNVFFECFAVVIPALLQLVLHH